jgi:hypothetical protein
MKIKKGKKFIAVASLAVVMAFGVVTAFSPNINTEVLAAEPRTNNAPIQASYTLHRNSITVNFEDGGTVVIADRMDVARVKFGTLRYSDLEITNRSTMSDLEFREGVVRGYIFGDISSMVRSGIFTWAELINPDVSGDGDLTNPSQNVTFDFDGNSIIVHMECDGAVTIVNGAEVIDTLVRGSMSVWDIEIINNSDISDTEFLGRLGRGHIFGYGGVSALRSAGIIDRFGADNENSNNQVHNDSPANISENAPATPQNSTVIDDVINAIEENNSLTKNHHQVTADFSRVIFELRDWRGSMSVYVTNENVGAITYGFGANWLGGISFRQEGEILYVSATGNTVDFWGVLGARPQDIVLIIGVDELAQISTTTTSTMGRGISITMLD